MIRIFDHDAKGDDWKRNGIGPLTPSKCTITETLNGEYELRMTHSMDEQQRWKRLARDRIIVVPAPAAPTPMFEVTNYTQYRKLINGVHEPFYGKVSPSTDAANKGSAIAPGSICYLSGQRKNGHTLLYASNQTGLESTVWAKALEDAEDGWCAVNFIDYTDDEYCYVQSRWLRTTYTDRYSNESGAILPGTSIIDTENGATAVLAEQAFRIYKIDVGLNEVEVFARHISYDGMGDPVIVYNSGTTINPAKAVIGLKENAQKWGSIARVYIYSDFDWDIDLEEAIDFNVTNVVEGLIGNGGILERCGGDIIRNNYMFYYMYKYGEDRGVRIRHGKNLKGIQYEEDWSETCFTIYPIGKKSSNNLYLNGSTSLPDFDNFSPPDYYITSPNSVYRGFRNAKAIEYSDADTVDKLKKAVERDFENGLDKPKISVTVDFLNVEDTVEYEQYKFLQGVFLGDTVHAIANRANIDVALRVTQYTFNCLTRKYDSITLGEPKKIDLKV